MAFQIKPRNVAAWAVAGAAFVAWTMYDQRKASGGEFSADEQKKWNAAVKDANPAPEAASKTA